MSEFWNLILESNTFNFVILLLIIWIIAVKADLPDKIEKLKFNVAAAIEHAKLERKQAERSLSVAKKELKEANIEAQNKIDTANINAKGFYDDIIANASAQISNLNDMAVRIAKSQESKASSALLSDTVLSAFMKAEKDVVNILESDFDMQIKLIEESIKSLEEMNL